MPRANAILRSAAYWVLAELSDHKPGRASVTVDGGEVIITVSIRPKADDKAAPAGKASKVSLALALLLEHPEWNNLKIAEVARCSAVYLSQSKRFKAARKESKALGREFLPRSKQRYGGHNAHLYADTTDESQ